MLIGVPLETAAGETRVAVTPETAKKLKAHWAMASSVQSGRRPDGRQCATDAAYVGCRASRSSTAVPRSVPTWC